MISVYVILFPVIIYPESISTEKLVFKIDVLVKTLFEALPSMIVGDIAGSIVAEIVGGR